MGTWGKLASLGAMAGGGLMLATGVGAPVGAALIGAGGMGAKHEFEDIPKEQRQNELAAETARYRPWTGLTPQAPDISSGIGQALQGGVAGAMVGQGLAKGAVPPTSQLAGADMTPIAQGADSIPIVPSGNGMGATPGALSGWRNLPYPVPKMYS